MISASENLKELLKLGVEPNTSEAPLDFNSDTWPLLLGVHIGSAQCDNIKRSKARDSPRFPAYSSRRPRSRQGQEVPAGTVIYA